MRWIFLPLLLLSLQGYSQWKSYVIGVQGDTLNRTDKNDKKQGKWVTRIDEVRGEPGYEEEGQYKDNRKEGVWRVYSLQGDLIGLETYRWGNKDGVCQYFTSNGALIREESWRAMNPDRLYDTVQIEDLNHLDQYKTVIVKNEGIAIRHGSWKFYDPLTGVVTKTQTYTLGKLETASAGQPTAGTGTDEKTVAKPKEVQDFEKKNSGKKKVKVRDGNVF